MGLGLGGGAGDDHRFAVADDDVLAGERLELGGEVAGAPMLVDPRFVVARPEVAESGVRVRQQMVDDGQYRVAGSDQRLLLAAAWGQAAIAGAEEGVGAGVGERDAAQGAGQPWVALGAALAPGLTGRLNS